MELYNLEQESDTRREDGYLSGQSMFIENVSEQQEKAKIVRDFCSASNQGIIIPQSNEEIIAYSPRQSSPFSMKNTSKIE